MPQETQPEYYGTQEITVNDLPTILTRFTKSNVIEEIAIVKENKPEMCSRAS
jgi:hypothetical protein